MPTSTVVAALLVLALLICVISLPRADRAKFLEQLLATAGRVLARR